MKFCFFFLSAFIRGSDLLSALPTAWSQVPEASTPREPLTKVFRRAGCGKSARPVRRGDSGSQLAVAHCPTLPSISGHKIFGIHNPFHPDSKQLNTKPLASTSYPEIMKNKKAAARKNFLLAHPGGCRSSQGLGCSPIKAVRELGSERRRTVQLSISDVWAQEI